MKMLFLLDIFDSNRSPLDYYCVNFIIQICGSSKSSYSIISANQPEQMLPPRTEHMRFPAVDRNEDLYSLLKKIKVETYDHIILSQELPELAGVLNLLGYFFKNISSKISLISHKPADSSLKSVLNTLFFKSQILSSLPMDPFFLRRYPVAQLPIVENLGITRHLSSPKSLIRKNFSFFLIEEKLSKIGYATELAHHLLLNWQKWKRNSQDEEIHLIFELWTQSPQRLDEMRKTLQSCLQRLSIENHSEIRSGPFLNADSPSLEAPLTRIFVSDDPISLFLCYFRAHHHLDSFFPRDLRFRDLFNKNSLNEFEFDESPSAAAEKIFETCRLGVQHLSLTPTKSPDLKNIFEIPKTKRVKVTPSFKARRQKTHLLYIPSGSISTSSQEIRSLSSSNNEFGKIFIYSPTLRAHPLKISERKLTFVSDLIDLKTLESSDDQVLVIRDFKKILNRDFLNQMATVHLPSNQILALDHRDGGHWQQLVTDERDPIQILADLSNYSFVATGDLALKFLKFSQGDRSMAEAMLAVQVVSLPASPFESHRIHAPEKRAHQKELHSLLLNQISAEIPWAQRQIEFLYQSLVD